jgi:hypothetical protein
MENVVRVSVVAAERGNRPVQCVGRRVPGNDQTDHDNTIDLAPTELWTQLDQKIERRAWREIL